MKPAVSLRKELLSCVFNIDGTGVFWKIIHDRMSLLKSVCLVLKLWKTDLYSYLVETPLRRLHVNVFTVT